MPRNLVSDPKKALRRWAWSQPTLVFSALRVFSVLRDLGVPMERLTGRGYLLTGRLVDRHTDLVIEAFPRSGNTFAEVAFRMAQTRPYKIAHHLHIPAQVVYAVRHAIPALVILRAPVDAVISAKIRNPCVSSKELLRDWISFYQAVRPIADRCVIATFEEITTDFGAVTRRLNRKYGTNFVPFEHNEQNTAAVFERIGDMNAARFGDGRVVETMVARPSTQRRERRAALLRELQGSKFQPLLHCAETLYQSVPVARRMSTGDSSVIAP